MLPIASGYHDICCTEVLSSDSTPGTVKSHPGVVQLVGLAQERDDHFGRLVKEPHEGHEHIGAARGWDAVAWCRNQAHTCT